MEIICKKYQILFSGKNKKTISVCHLLKHLLRVLSDKDLHKENLNVKASFADGGRASGVW